MKVKQIILVKFSVIIIVLFFGHLISLNSVAVEPDEVLSNPKLEIRARNISKNIRCMTCQNQSIYDSETDFAIDIKKIIIKKLNEGQDQNEIFDFLVERYGEYILFEPRLNKKNIFLWIFPFFVFFISAIFLLIYINKNKISK